MAKQSHMSIVAQDELCNWEFINQSDFDDDDDCIFEVQSIDFLDDDDDVSLSSSDDQEQQESEEEQEKGVIHDVVDDDDVMGSSLSSPSPSPTTPRHQIQGYVRAPVGCVFDLRHNLYPAQSYDDVDDDVEEKDDDVEDEDDGYDIDDELVPWGVKNKFERQRMRKLGKRAFAKMTKSKKSAFLYTRPGCVRGKHGLGLKAY